MNGLASDRCSGWKEKAEWRRDNRAWLDKSAAIALVVLDALRSKAMSPKELAEKTGIPLSDLMRGLKGEENFNLEVICKLEEALEMGLVSVPCSFANNQ